MSNEERFPNTTPQHSEEHDEEQLDFFPEFDKPADTTEVIPEASGDLKFEVTPNIDAYLNLSKRSLHLLDYLSRTRSEVLFDTHGAIIDIDIYRMGTDDRCDDSAWNEKHRTMTETILREHFQN